MYGYGPRETFRNCADIRIVRNPNAPNAVYTPKAYNPEPELFLIYPDTPIIFTCASFGPAPARFGLF
jgi:hypothetical protein